MNFDSYNFQFRVPTGIRGPHHPTMLRVEYWAAPTSPPQCQQFPGGSDEPAKALRTCHAALTPKQATRSPPGFLSKPISGVHSNDDLEENPRAASSQGRKY
jgi:hypothetical protein